MPRLSKKYKQEWQFFLDDRNRMKYNELCKKCEKECKWKKEAFYAKIEKTAAAVFYNTLMEPHLRCESIAVKV